MNTCAQIYPKKFSTFKLYDLFHGMGGFRLGFEQACKDHGIGVVCTLASDIKPAAITTYSDNFEKVSELDVSKVDLSAAPDCDILLAGFPCQPFSSAGQRRGFEDTRGTLFFEVCRILESKKPVGFILENVEGLVTHDKGKTFQRVLECLQSLGYEVTARILNSSEYGVPQARKRIFFLGSKKGKVRLSRSLAKPKVFRDIQETVNPAMCDFAKKVFASYEPSEILGKAFKDKRGGPNNIHSWDLGLRGKCTKRQRELLNVILKERRKQFWAETNGLPKKDGVPLTIAQLDYLTNESTRSNLISLEKKGYVKRHLLPCGDEGYDLTAGKLSFEYSQVIDPDKPLPTLVATDMGRLAVCDGVALRPLTSKEGLRAFGFPDTFKLPPSARDYFDLLGNTVAPPVIQALAKDLICTLHKIPQKDLLSDDLQTELTLK